MKHLNYGIGTKYVRLSDPTWEQVYDVISSLNGETVEPFRRGLVYSDEILMVSIACMLGDPERVLLRLHLVNEPTYRNLDSTLPAIEDESHYVTVVGSSEAEYILIHETIPKNEAIEMLHAIYHDHKLPPKERWLAYS